MPYLPIATSDTRSIQSGGYTEQVVQHGKFMTGFWRGFALLRAGQVYSSIDITFPSEHRGTPNKTSALIYANTRIQSVGFINRGLITLGAATGRIKFAPTLTNATTTIYVESAAASSNALAVPANAVETLNFDAAVTVGGSDVTYRLFATDGAAAGAAAASTMSVATDTFIDVEIGFIAAARFGLRNAVTNEFGVLAPSN